QSPEGFNRIARIIAEQRHLDAWDAARLLAVLQMGEFDSYATNFDSKYYYSFWRPVTAIALVDGDGNPETSAVAGWEVLSFPTPPVPDYPSAHSSAGATAAAIIDGLIPGRGEQFSTTSTSLPGVTRTFRDIDAAAQENAHRTSMSATISASRPGPGWSKARVSAPSSRSTPCIRFTAGRRGWGQRQWGQRQLVFNRL